MNRLHPWFETHEAHGTSIPSQSRPTPFKTLRRTADEPTPVALDRSSDGRPLRVVLPEPYEANYAYPLVVWLHGGGGSEHDAVEVATGISTQNFVAVGLRGTRPTTPSRFHWNTADVRDGIAALGETLREMRRTYHVHSERIFVAGVDEGATAALQLLLAKPEWFAGAIAWNGGLPKSDRPLARFRDLKGKRVLLGSGTDTGIAAAVRNAVTARLLHSAGLDVTNHTYDTSGGIAPEMLRDANNWLVEAACAIA